MSGSVCDLQRCVLWQVVEFLISVSGDINAKDRWQGTPLLDAVNNKHSVVASLLRMHGAKLSLSHAGSVICNAAAENNLETLDLLIQNGICVNEARPPFCPHFTQTFWQRFMPARIQKEYLLATGEHRWTDSTACCSNIWPPARGQHPPLTSCVC